MSLISLPNTVYEGFRNEEQKRQQLEKYISGVLEWNDKVNLTSITQEDEFIKKHIEDSLTIVDSPEIKRAKTVIDLGTGGGFPGIPLAIAFPNKEFVLADALAKRLKIVAELCDVCNIHNVTVLHGRAEDLGRASEYREKFDLCVSRAVSSLNILAEYCLPFVRVGGSFIAYKGRSADVELQEASTAIELLGGSFNRIDEVCLDEDTVRQNIYIDKITNTQQRFPRRAGKPQKKPL